MPSALPLKARQCPLQYPVAICFFHPVQSMVYKSGEYPTLPGPLRCRILEESLREKKIRGRKYSLQWTDITFEVLAEQLALRSTARQGRGDWAQAHRLSLNRVMERQTRISSAGVRSWKNGLSQQNSRQPFYNTRDPADPTLNWHQAGNLQMWVLLVKGEPCSLCRTLKAPRIWGEMILSRSLSTGYTLISFVSEKEHKQQFLHQSLPSWSTAGVFSIDWLLPWLRKYVSSLENDCLTLNLQFPKIKLNKWHHEQVSQHRNVSSSS